MRKFVVLIGAAAFILGVAGLGFAETWDDFFYGSVTKIQGSTVTIKSDAGVEKIFQTTSPAGIKVGDKVRAKGSMIKGSWDWGNTAPRTQIAPGAKSGIRAEEEGEGPVQTRQRAIAK